MLPNRRSTAEAFQILISHAFGDAGSPYLIGVVRHISGNRYDIRNNCLQFINLWRIFVVIVVRVLWLDIWIFKNRTESSVWITQQSLRQSRATVAIFSIDIIAIIKRRCNDFKFNCSFQIQLLSIANRTSAIFFRFIRRIRFNLSRCNMHCSSPVLWK